MIPLNYFCRFAGAALIFALVFLALDPTFPVVGGFVAAVPASWPTLLRMGLFFVFAAVVVAITWKQLKEADLTPLFVIPGLVVLRAVSDLIIVAANGQANAVIDVISPTQLMIQAEILLMLMGLGYALAEKRMALWTIVVLVLVVSRLTVLTLLSLPSMSSYPGLIPITHYEPVTAMEVLLSARLRGRGFDREVSLLLASIPILGLGFAALIARTGLALLRARKGSESA